MKHFLHKSAAGTACLFMLLFFAVLQGNAQTAFTSGNLVVVNINSSGVVSLLEYTPAGSLIQTITLPSTGSSAAFTLSSTAGSEGALARSANGQYLALAGYRTGSKGSATARVFARVSPDGTVNTATSITNAEGFTGDNVRGALFSDDGNNYWATGNASGSNGGLRYGTFNTTSGSIQVTSNPTNMRTVHIFNSQLYVGTNKASFTGVNKVGAGIPTNTGNTTTLLNGFSSSESPYAFSINSAGTVMYVADDGGGSSALAGVQKWTLSGAIWVLQTTISVGTGVGATGLTVDWSGANPIIYATTTETSTNRIVKIVDGTTPTVSTLVTTTTGNFVRGIAFSPVTAATTPVVNLSVSTNSASEAAATAVTVTATASAAVTGAQTVNIAVSGTGITAGDYNLSSSTITIPNGATTGSVTFTIVDDAAIEGTETATLTISSPSSGITLGSTVSQNVTITDNDFANNPPTIVMDVANTSNYIDGGASTSPASPYYLSGVISDPTDPAKTLGTVFTVNDVETAAGSLTVTATSNNQSVVANANIAVTGGGTASRTVKITPSAAGYADITVTVSDGVNNTSYVVKYAASVAAVTPSVSNFFTGTSDASTAQALDADYMLVGDDENQVLRLYNRNNSGLPVNGFDYTSSLGETDLSHPEVDIEASVKIGSRIYWMGSHDNSSSGNNRPNRSRIFATDISGTGAATTLTYVGRYDNLKTDLKNWDANNLHGQGANYYGLTASSATGILPEASDGSGFNIEALTIAPDGTTGYIAFRAPLEPTASRTKGLIIPVTNFTSLVSGNPTSTTATFGTPILLDLGGRGIREIKRSSGGQYLIIAGPVDGATGVSPKDFRLYTWTGNASDAPGLRTADLTSIISADGSFESIVDLPATLTSSSQVQLLEDNGDVVYYGDGTIAKDLSQNNLKKFHGVTVALGTVVCGTVNAGTITGFNTTCTGSHNLVLSNTVTGGVWSSLYDSVATISNAGLVTAVTAGDDVIKYTVTDANGCTGTATFALRVNFRPQSTLNVTVCKSTLPYHWNGMDLTTAGTYTFTTTSAIGCDSLARLNLRVSDPVITIIAPNVQCYGGTTQVAIYAAGGRSPYSGTGKFKVLAGTYTYTVTDDSGCVATKTITLTEPSPVSVTVNAPDVLCNGGTTTVTVDATGGVAPLAYNLKGTATQPGNTFTGIKSGTNTATLTDGSGCKYSLPFTVTQPVHLKLTLVSKTTPSCKTAHDATVNVSASGGVGSYQFSIDGGTFSSSSTFTGLASGIHPVTVKDDNGCTLILNVSVSASARTCPATFAANSSNGGETSSSATAGKQPVSQLSIHALPNPSEGEFRLNIQGGNKTDVTIIVTNVYGQKVYQTKGNVNNQFRFGGNFVPGMYIVRVLQGSEVKTLKLVKTKG